MLGRPTVTLLFLTDASLTLIYQHLLHFFVVNIFSGWQIFFILCMLLASLAI